MAISVVHEAPPLERDVYALIDALDTHLAPLSPPEYQFGLTPDAMTDPDVFVIVARDEDGVALGCGALKVHPDGVGEIKRMFTLAQARGRGVGAKILERLVALGREKGLARIVIETGTGDDFASAARLYETGGFTACGPVLGYPDSGYSAFFEKTL